MTDKTKQTTRFGFQKIGGSQELEPADYNSMLDTLDAQTNGPAHAAADFTSPGAGVTVGAATNVNGVQSVRLTLAAVVISLTDALKYGSESLMTWPNTNLIVASARMNLTCVKDGTGTTAASTPHVSVGSAAASNSTLATTMVDTVEQVTLAGTLSAVAQKNGPHTAGNRYIAAGASNAIFLNASNAGSSSSADGTLTVSGTIDVFFTDTGTFG